MSQYYPVALDLRDRPCLVVGGGPVAEAKVEGLLDAGARVTVVSPSLTERLASWATEGRIAHRQREYIESDCEGQHLAFSATDRREVTEAVAADASRRGVRVNAADDPFVFGRGGEEALALSKAGIAFEVVPGISSAIAVPAYAGIPVTHRGVASSFAVLTGHEDPSKDGDAVDWARLATAVDTLVVLMAVGTFPRIVGALLANGRLPETPVALIRWGTTEAQEVRVGTLADIVGRARGLEPPVVAVIGEVVALRERLAWAVEVAADVRPVHDRPAVAFPSATPV